MAENRDGGNGNGSSWTEYRRLVLAELQRLNDEIDSLRREIRTNDAKYSEEDKKRDIEQAKTTAKLTVYAAIGSLISGTILSIIVHFLIKMGLI